MKLILTYNGPLRANRASAKHKCELRAHFHKQLFNFWMVNPSLSLWKTDGEYFHRKGCRYEKRVPLKECYAREFKDARTGVHFVPLAIKKLHLHCKINILLLVRSKIGSLFVKGDIDNRTKTLLDGLRMPRQSSEIKDPIMKFKSEKKPLFVLMEDDNRVTELSVRYQTLLDYPISHNSLTNKTRFTKKDTVSAIIEVDVYPSPVTFDTDSFL